MGKSNHCQLACRQFFGHQHRDIMQRKNISIDQIDSQWSHPNEYFDQGRTLYYGEKKKEEGGAQGQGQDQGQKMDVEMNGTVNGGGNVANKENQHGGNTAVGGDTVVADKVGTAEQTQR